MVALRNDMEALKAIITDSMSLITKMVSLQHSGANQNVHQVKQVAQFPVSCMVWGEGHSSEFCTVNPESVYYIGPRGHQNFGYGNYGGGGNQSNPCYGGGQSHEQNFQNQNFQNRNFQSLGQSSSYGPSEGNYQGQNSQGNFQGQGGFHQQQQNSYQAPQSQP